MSNTGDQGEMSEVAQSQSHDRELAAQIAAFEEENRLLREWITAKTDDHEAQVSALMQNMQLTTNPPGSAPHLDMFAGLSTNSAATVASLQAQLEALTAEVAGLKQELHQLHPSQPTPSPQEKPVHTCDCVANPKVSDLGECLWCQRKGHTEEQCRHKRRCQKQARRWKKAAVKTEGNHQDSVVSSQDADSSRQPVGMTRGQYAESFLPKLSPGELHRLQRADAAIGPVLNSWPAKPSVCSNWQLWVLLQQHGRLLRRKGVLYRRVKDPKRGDCEQLVLPSSLRSQVISRLHRRLGHRGYKRAAEVLRPQVYWPGMYQEVEQYLETCKTCSKFHQPARGESSVSAWQRRRGGKQRPEKHLTEKQRISGKLPEDILGDHGTDRLSESVSGKGMEGGHDGESIGSSNKSFDDFKQESVPNPLPTPKSLQKMPGQSQMELQTVSNTCVPLSVVEQAPLLPRGLVGISQYLLGRVTRKERMNTIEHL